MPTLRPLGGGATTRISQLRIRFPIHDAEADTVFMPYDVIVLTHTCDLANNKIDRVYLCPVYTLDEYFAANPSLTESEKSVRAAYERLKQGQITNMFLTNPCDTLAGGHLREKYLIAYFHKTVIVSAEYVDAFLRKSRRKNFPALAPPYREALAQHYGRYFMRVGNPEDYARKEDIDAAKFVRAKRR